MGDIWEIQGRYRGGIEGLHEAQPTLECAAHHRLLAWVEIGVGVGVGLGLG